MQMMTAEVRAMLDHQLKQSPRKLAEGAVASEKRATKLEQALIACVGAMDSMRTQIDQMRGMFSDEDGAIDAALNDHDDAVVLAVAALSEVS